MPKKSVKPKQLKPPHETDETLPPEIIEETDETEEIEETDETEEIEEIPEPPPKKVVLRKKHNPIGDLTTINGKLDAIDKKLTKEEPPPTPPPPQPEPKKYRIGDEFDIFQKD